MMFLLALSAGPAAAFLDSVFCTEANLQLFDLSDASVNREGLELFASREYDSKSTADKPGSPRSLRRRFSNAILVTMVWVSKYPERLGIGGVSPRTSASP